MGATARKINVGAASGSLGSWSDIPTPSDQRMTLVEVEDYDNSDKKPAGEGTFGWIFTYAIEGKLGLRVKTWLTVGPKDTAHWKIVNVADAHDYALADGLSDFDPNALVGDTILCTLDYERDAQNVPKNQYRNIQAFYQLPADGFVSREAPLLTSYDVEGQPDGVEVAEVPDRF